MNAIVGFKLCTLSDEDLIEAVDKATDKMYSEPYRVPCRSIPAKPNEDYDLLIGELLVRFKNAVIDSGEELLQDNK